MRIFTWLTASLSLLLAAACTSTVTGDTSSSSGGGGSTTSSTQSSSSHGGGGSTTSSTSSTSSTGGSGGGQSCADPADPSAFEVGTGESCFERLTDGQTVSVMAGPQGGFHLWLAVGCMDCGAQAIMRYGVKDPATGTWYNGTSENNVVFPLDPNGWHQGAGLQAYLPGLSWQPETVLPKGTHVILYGAVLDAGMKVLHEAEVEVVLGDTMAWSPPCDPGPNCGTPGGLPCCSDGNK